MAALYLDDCLIASVVIRPLRAAGHLVYVTSELGLKGQADEMHLETATGLWAIMATQNQGDFTLLHRRWQADGRHHAGILLTRQIRDIGARIERLERAARLLAPKVAANQLLRLDHFDSEERGLLYVASLQHLAP